MNLLLVIQRYGNEHLILPDVVKEFERIGRERGRSYRVRLVHDYRPHWKHKLWSLGQPTVVVSMEQLNSLKPKWATIWTQVNQDKAWEYKILERAGLPIPKWVVVCPGQVPSLSGFDDFVVTKPSKGGCGALVRVMRKNRIQWRESEIKKYGWTSDELIVQQYVHTGAWPTSYRVGTVFGEPYYAWRIMANQSRKPFDSEATRDSRFFEGRTIVASSKGCAFDEQVDPDILELGRKVHKAFPTVPVLGIDIVREFRTGKLYVMEVNAVGDTFHLTSDTGKKIAREFNLDVSGQFGGARAVALGIYNRMRKFEANFSEKSRAQEERTSDPSDSLSYECVS